MSTAIKKVPIPILNYVKLNQKATAKKIIPEQIYRWNKEQLKILFGFTPSSVQNLEPVYSWINQQGGHKGTLEKLRGYSVVLEGENRKLLELLLQYPGKPADFYAQRLNISRATYYRYWTKLTELLLEFLNQTTFNLQATRKALRTSLLINLPHPLSVYVGNSQALEKASTLLLEGRVRLITIFGPAGIGKTRFSVEIAQKISPAFEQGAYFVPLKTKKTSAAFLQQLAQVIGVTLNKTDLLNTLKEYFKERQILLVLDNFEHLLDATPMLEELLEATSNLKIMVTSREVLNISGEYQFEVPRLAVPTVAVSMPLAELIKFDAVRLFLDRARMVKSDFELDINNCQTIAQICNRLEGQPLAIELAASQIKILTPELILAMLDHPFAFLNYDINYNQFQKTLSETLAWSYTLLTHQEQLLIQRLALFRGGCTLEAIQAVGNFDELYVDILVGIKSLLDKSLLSRQIDQQDEPRFRMLEIFREFVLSNPHLNEKIKCYDYFMAYFLKYVTCDIEALSLEEQNQWLSRLETDIDNIRAVLDYLQRQIEKNLNLALTQGYFQLYFDFLAGLHEYWVRKGYSKEAKNYFSWLWGIMPTLNTDATLLSKTVSLVAVLYASGIIALQEADYLKASKFFEESLTFSKELNLKREISNNLRQLGLIAHYQGNYVAASQITKESLTLKKELNDLVGIAKCFNNLAITASELGNYQEAIHYYEEGIKISRYANNFSLLALFLGNKASYLLENGAISAAKQLLEESLSLRRNLGDNFGIAIACENLGRISRDAGDFATAQVYYQESLGLLQALGNRRELAIVFSGIGILAQRQKNFDEAGSLLLKSLILRREIGDKRGEADSLASLAYLEQEQGYLDKARFLLLESLRIWHSIGSNSNTVLDTLKVFLALQTNTEVAARLSGTLAAIEPHFTLAKVAFFCQEVQSHLDLFEKPEIIKAFNEGKSSTLAQTLSYICSTFSATSENLPEYLCYLFTPPNIFR